jgi:hypothetical protein
MENPTKALRKQMATATGPPQNCPFGRRLQRRGKMSAPGVGATFGALVANVTAVLTLLTLLGWSRQERAYYCCRSLLPHFPKSVQCTSQGASAAFAEFETDS